MRAKERAKPYLVSIGYRGPKKVRGLHPKGAPEILVHTVQDVERIEEEREKEKEGIKKEEGKEIKREEGKRKGKKGKKGKKGIKPDCVIKIASTVGTRKKAEIVRAAVEKNMYVANPSVAFAKVCSTEELEHLLPIKQYIKAWFISDKLTDDEREEVEARAEEEGIEVME